MEILSFAFNGVAPICLMALIGMLLRRLGWLSRETASKVNQLCFKLFIPMQIFRQIYRSDLSAAADWKLLAFCLGLTALTLALLCLIVPRFIKRRVWAGEFIQGVFRSNSAILGLPLLINLYGDAAGNALSLVLPLMIILYNLCAPVVLMHFSESGQKKQGPAALLKRVFTNPFLIAALLGTFFSATGLGTLLPDFLTSTVTSLSNVGTPLALIGLGAITEIETVRRCGKTALTASLFRLLLIPIPVLCLGALLGFRGVQMGVLVCFFSTPTAVGGYVLAKNIDGDGELAGQILLQTTLLSFLTMFLTIAALRGLALM